ncbi:MAG: hypothetical protein JSV05_04970 [Candidatus Bathyarchaeota archaeon]|nr:MAG: hypothetical protein JSV05_04970 [Candidatus Bathyarchaeota archaeon]
MVKCWQCDTETYMPFKCPYCSQYFCVEHRLPENHNCSRQDLVRAPRAISPEETKMAQSEPSYRYTMTMGPSRKQGEFAWFSATEIKHLLLGALLTLAIGLSMPLYWSIALFEDPLILTSLATVFTFSFLTHELAHKITAQRYGLWAEFRITRFGALITLLSIFSPFKVISPGAVMVAGVADRKTIGKTSVAGPMTNIALTVFFLVGVQAVQGPIAFVFKFGVMINSFIALFNLIPFGVLDGFKVFFWSKLIWGIAFSLSLALTIYSYVVLSFI